MLCWLVQSTASFYTLACTISCIYLAAQNQYWCHYQNNPGLVMPLPSQKVSLLLTTFLPGTVVVRFVFLYQTKMLSNHIQWLLLHFWSLASIARSTAGLSPALALVKFTTSWTCFVFPSIFSLTVLLLLLLFFFLPPDFAPDLEGDPFLSQVLS